jgi:hypothetical protein
VINLSTAKVAPTTISEPLTLTLQTDVTDFYLRFELALDLDEWQQAVAQAHGSTALDDARRNGDATEIDSAMDTSASMSLASERLPFVQIGAGVDVDAQLADLGLLVGVVDARVCW